MRLETLHAQPTHSNGAPPLLFLPGAFHGAWCFAEHWLPYFAARGYDAYALSYRGHGQSEGSSRGARLSDYLEDVRSVIATLPARPVVIGHSMGGFLVQHLISAEAFPAAVMAAPVPWRGMNWPVVIRDALRFPWAIARSFLTGDLAPLVRSRRFARGFFAAISEEALTAIHARLEGESVRAFNELGPFGWRADPRGCTTPTLVLAAGQDRSWTPARLADTARVFRAELQIVDGAGHDVMLDGPWEDAAARIHRWLALRVLPSTEPSAAMAP